MDLAEFTDGMTGILVPLQDTTPDVSHAFVPNPLPPAWKLPESLWPTLVEARASIAGLDGVGKHLPNHDILLRPIQRREAQLSSKLEGTFTDPQKQALFQADPTYPTSASDPLNPYREVFNYGRALRLRQDSDLPLSKRLIRDLHTVLMDGVRDYGEQPGEFRTIQNQIGHPARFVPPPPENVVSAMDDLEGYMNTPDCLDPLIRAFLAHYQFEAVHPFRDGNGRVGRLLLAVTIAEWCDLSSQWLYMSAYFERHRKQYMDLMLRVSTHGDWDRWIQFCLQGAIDQAKDTERRCDKLLTLHRDFHSRLKGGSVRLSALVDRLFENPIVTVVDVKATYNVTYPTARSDLRKLEVLGILKPLQASQITYYCDPIYTVTYADTIDA